MLLLVVELLQGTDILTWPIDCCLIDCPVGSYVLLSAATTRRFADRLVCRFGRNVQTCIPDGHLHRATYTRCIDTIDSPDDENGVARNM